VRGRLRERLLAAFVLVSVVPLILLASGTTVLVSRTFERLETTRLLSALSNAEAEVRRIRERSAARVAAAVSEHLGSDELEANPASTIARWNGFDAFEIVDAGGRVVSSSHWQVAFGLPDKDGLFPGDPALRVEKVAEGYGAAERLALMPGQAATFRGAPVTVRGGVFLDSDFLAALGGLTGVDLGLRDALRRRWIVADGSPLGSWPAPPLAGGPDRGDAELGGDLYRWVATPLHPSLWLVAAAPRTALDQVTRRLWTVSLATAAAVLLAALAAAVFLSGRIARPVAALAGGARKIAEGDQPGSVRVSSDDEIGDLARAFNTMSAELRTSRERLLQAERVAAWREMARRLAHELKNPIFPIQVSIETLRRAHDKRTAEPTSPEEAERFSILVRESTDTVLEELRALRTIIDEFSQFARMPRPSLAPTDLNALVQRVLGLYHRPGSPVQVVLDAQVGLPAVDGDRDLLSRAVSNLVANAFDAMPEGGTLRIRTSGGPDGVALEVADTGPGLTEEQRTRLFTPYFTTKKGGTGLGLAIVQGIVSDHGGRIEVRSSEAGTTFVILMPASRGQA